MAVNLRAQKILSNNSRNHEKTIETLNSLAEFDLIKGLETANGSTLRRDVENQLVASSKDFLKAFEQVNENLNLLESHLAGMHLCCDQISDRLQSANVGTKYLIQHAQGLRQQRAVTTVKQAVITAFLSRFTLQPAESQALTSASVPVGPALFAALDKVQRIREDCRILLDSSSISDDHKIEGDSEETTRAGLDIMRVTSKQLDEGYSKMFKWASFQIRGYTRSEADVSNTMREVIQRLKEREDLLQELMNLLAGVRSNAVSTHFIEALTRGSPTGLPRPIELHAHDPIRYVGDMLAWIHQAMAGEREFLEGLFGIREDGRLPGAVRPTIAAHNVEARKEDQHWIQTLMDRDLEGCGRPLKMRIQQTIHLQEGSLIALQIRNLVAFYNITIERTIGKDALMSKVLSEIAEAATVAFYDVLDTAGRSYLRFIQPPPADLSVPLMLRDALTILRDILDVYHTSMLDQAEDLQTFIPVEEILTRALDPPVEMCKRMAEMRPNEWDQNVFLLNCLGLVKTVLEPYFSISGPRLETTTKEMDGYSERLITDHFKSIIRESGLEAIVAALDDRTDETPLARHSAASAAALSTALRNFDAFLTTSLLSTSPRLAYLGQPRLAEYIHREALTKLGQAYGRLYEVVMSGKEGYEFDVTRMRRTPADVDVLLGIDS